MSEPNRGWVRSIGRLALVLLLLAAGARAVVFLYYLALAWPNPLETYHVEAKMVHLAWRVEQGLRLYPPWRTYPHVANIYAPVYFWLVGWLGRMRGASLEGLFLIGRTVTVASDVLTSLVLGVAAWRRGGRGAAVAAVAFSLGAAPMIGFGVMARPDALADLLGLAGFLLAVATGRRQRIAGGMLLGLAVLTKQTAALYLGAAVLTLLVQRERRAAVGLGGLVGLAVAAVVLVVTVAVEPGFGRDFLSERRSPWVFAAFVSMCRRLAIYSPDLLLAAVVGLGLWSFGPWRDPALAVLTVVMTVGGLVTSGKIGADLNYFLPLRAIEALAAGEVWRASGSWRGRHAVFWLFLIYPAAVYSMYVSNLQLFGQTTVTRNEALFLASPIGRARLGQYRQLWAQARDPRVRMLTDRGLLDIQQGERTVSGDPFQFRLLYLTGQIKPDRIERSIEDEAYDWIATSKPLEDPGYEQYLAGLPMPLVKAARRHYVFVTPWADLFIYRPRRLLGATAVRPTAPR